MKTKYGNSLNHGTETVSVDSLSVWAKVSEMYPTGAFIKVDSTNTVGKKIPAGTPIAVDKVGGTVTLNGTAPIGCTYEDAYVGTDGCTVGIVTKGVLNESLIQPTISSTQKGKLTGLTFVKEA